MNTTDTTEASFTGLGKADAKAKRSSTTDCRSLPCASLVAAAVAASLIAGCNQDDDSGQGSASAQLNDLKGSTKDLTVELKEGTNMAATPSPDGKRRCLHRARRALDRADRRRRGDAHHQLGHRADRTRLVARRQDDRLPELHPGRQLAHLDDQPRRLQCEGDHHRLLRRPRARLDAGRRRAGVRVRPQQRRPVQDLALHAGHRRLCAVDDRRGRRKQSGGLARRQADRLRRHCKGLYRTDRRRRAARLLGPGSAPAWAANGAGLIYQTATRALNAGGKDIAVGEDLFPFPVRLLADGRFLYAADGKLRIRDANRRRPDRRPVLGLADRAASGVHEDQGPAVRQPGRREPPRASARRSSRPTARASPSSR